MNRPEYLLRKLDAISPRLLTSVERLEKAAAELAMWHSSDAALLAIQQGVTHDPVQEATNYATSQELPPFIAKAYVDRYVTVYQSIVSKYNEGAH